MSRRHHRLPASLWALGGVSLLMDMSSELIHSLLPVFMATVLGASMLTIGIIEGAAEALTLVVKVVSGTLSDRWRRRKPLVVAGYSLAALSKPLFALAASVEPVVLARLLDRIGKGVRDAPRDALITDITATEVRGAAFGLRQALDTVGAVLGPLLALGLMLAWDQDFRAVFWVAVLPAALCVMLLVWGVREPAQAPQAPAEATPRAPAGAWRQLPPAYWAVVLLGGLLTLSRLTEAFLVLRIQQGGLPVALAPLVLVAMNVVYAAAAYPVGRLADRWSRRGLLGFGLLCLVLAHGLLAWQDHGALAWLGIGLWGLHMACTQGVLAAMVSVTAPAHLRGTAFGVFNLASGLALLLGSAVAGAVWDVAGPAATFMLSTGLACLTLLMLMLSRVARSPGAAD